MLSLEKLSTGSKHTVRFLESKRFLSQCTTRNMALFGGESGSNILFSPHRAWTDKWNLFFFFFNLESQDQTYSVLTKGSYFLENFLRYLSHWLRAEWVPKTSSFGGGGKGKDSQQCSRNCQRLVEHKESRRQVQKSFCDLWPGNESIPH